MIFGGEAGTLLYVHAKKESAESLALGKGKGKLEKEVMNERDIFGMKPGCEFPKTIFFILFLTDMQTRKCPFCTDYLF